MKAAAPSVHRRIYDEISGKITSGGLKPGDRLPSEADLMCAYGCSRMTVYKALSALQAEGLIERRRKAGSFVATPRITATVLEIPDLEAQAEACGDRYEFRLVSQEIVGGDLELAGVHVRNGRPLCYERRVIYLATVPEAVEVDFSQVSPGRWLLQQVPWSAATSRISAVPAEGHVSRYLELAKGDACLQVERETWRDGAAVTLVRQVFDGAHYALVARF